MRTRLRLAVVLSALALAACQGAPPLGGSFADDLSLLQRSIGTVVLTAPTGARIAVVPALGGAVMTSTTGGEAAPSFGWLDRPRIAAARRGAPMPAGQGEDRCEFGPVGGRFAVLPAVTATPFAVVEHGAARIACAGELELRNAAGTTFRLAVRREVRLCDGGEVLSGLGVGRDAGVRVVSFETITAVTNAGDTAWTKDGGLPAPRIVGTFPAHGRAHVMIPFVGGPERYHGAVVLGDESRAREANELRIDLERSLLVATTTSDGAPIAIGPRRAKPVLGGWDAARGVLTLLEFTLPIETQDYVDWHGERPDDPFGGAVVTAQPANAPEAGHHLASHAPALALAPGGKAVHVHRTTHLTGPREELATIARRVLGADLGVVPHGER